MKNFLAILIFLFVVKTGFGQDCVVFKNDTFNCIDNSELKQGLWRDYNIYYYLDDSLKWYSDNGRLVEVTPKHGASKIIDSSLVISKEGFYKDNKKIGIWKYYSVTGCSRYSTRTEYYKQDGSFEMEENDFKINYNSDSSIVKGMTTYPKDNISLECLDRLCKTSFDNIVVYEFKQKTNDIDIEIIKIVERVYYREIERIKELK